MKYYAQFQTESSGQAFKDGKMVNVEFGLTPKDAEYNALIKE